MRLDEIPIYVGLAILVALFFDKRIKLHAVWLWYAVPFAVVGVFLPYVLAQLGNENYNLVEMFRQDRMLPGVRLAALCLLTPLAVSLSVAAWVSGSKFLAACWMPASCLVTWGLLRQTMTVESIQDILGAPVMDWPADLEYILRLSAIYVSFVWLPTFLAMVSQHLRHHFAPTILYSIIAASAAVIVNGYTPSDNVPEIFREHGHSWFAAVCLLVPWIAILCDRAYQRYGLLAAVVTVVLPSALASVMLDKAVLLSDIHGLQVGSLAVTAAFSTAVMCLLPAAITTRQFRGF